MKTFQDKLNEIARTIGKDKTTLSTNSEPFDYQKQRAEYDTLANQEITKLQQDSKQKRVENLYGKSELSTKWTFDTLQADAPDVVEAISIAKSFIAAHKDNNWRSSGAHMMIFYGDYGRGKSHIAGAIAHQLIQKFEITVLYRQLQTLLEMRFFSYDFTAEDQAAQQFREINKQLQEVDLLITKTVLLSPIIS